MSSVNTLVIVSDQLRADVIWQAGTFGAVFPNLRRLADVSRKFLNHHTVTVPCGPARASLLTGQYAMDHRSVRNGVPLLNQIPTLPQELRKLGREPLLFGYTDTQPDPSNRSAADPVHNSYSSPMEGFVEVQEMRDEMWSWLAYLRGKGYDVPQADTPESDNLFQPKGGRHGAAALYAKEDSDTAFLTDRFLEQMDVRRHRPWTAFLNFIRPHPPLVAPAPYHAMFDASAVPAPHVAEYGHPFFDAFHSAPSEKNLFWGFDGQQSRIAPKDIQQARATYLGLVAELDLHIGRILDWLDATGQRDNTLLVFTADHGEMLGDLGIWGKGSVFPQASHIPLMISGPGVAPGTCRSITESVDLAPTLLHALQGTPPVTMSGRNLLSTDQPVRSDCAMIEVELGAASGNGRFEKTWDRPSDRCRAAVLQTPEWRYVHFQDGLPGMLFDVQTDPFCTKNLWHEHPKIAGALQASLLDERMARSVVPFAG